MTARPPLRRASWLLCVLAQGIAALSLAQSPVRPLGQFSNLHQDAEHCSGYSVDLWTAEGKLLGLLHACAGLTGDLPASLLEDTALNPSTGAIRFSARLTLGSDYRTGGLQTPSQDVFRFAGSLHPRTLNGTLSHRDEASKDPTTSQPITLRRTHTALKTYRSIENWQTNVSPSHAKVIAP